jgi:hypothetical protein
VIKAFNEDLPYDQFVKAQLAADQMDEKARAGMLPALGFLGLGPWFYDNGAVEITHADERHDRVDVVSRGFLGLTVGCARCHDHKFDPIPTRDYYSLYGVFQSSEERVVALDPAPNADQVMAFSRAQAYVAFEQGLTERVSKLDAKFKQASDEVAQRLRARARDYLAAVLEVAKLPSDANVRPQPEDINPFNVRQWERYLTTHAGERDPIFSPWHQFARLTGGEFSGRAPALAKTIAANADRTWNPLVARLFTNAPTDLADMARRYGELFTQVHQQWQSNLAAQAKAKTKPERLPDADAEALRQVLYGPDAPVLPPAGLVTELDVHLYFDDPNRVALANLQTAIEQWLIQHESARRYAVVLADRPTPAQPVVFRRGDPSKPGEPVPRQFLEILAGAHRRPFAHGSGRLELARAIASPDNPLTARVAVNRVWAHHFGAGLVRTLSDFGTRSEPPSHPELLDWLALQFIADGWSIKRLHRLILLSNTYQQSSSLPGSRRELAELTDPENKLLFRFPRQRLDFEALRDSLLAATGELDPGMGGPAVDLSRPPFSKRRAVYGRIDRKFLPGMLRSFDFANPDVHTPERHITASPQQALFLFNDPFVAERCRALVAQIRGGGSTEVSGRIRQLYVAVLQRVPRPSELRQAEQFLRDSDSGASSGPPAAPAQGDRLLTPWEQLAQVLFFSNDFLFVD